MSAAFQRFAQQHCSYRLRKWKTFCVFRYYTYTLPRIPSSHRAQQSFNLPLTWPSRVCCCDVHGTEHDGGAVGVNKTVACKWFPSALKCTLYSETSLPKTVIKNDANNMPQHISGYYKQTDGSLPGRVWKSAEILEGLEGEELCPWLF